MKLEFAELERTPYNLKERITVRSDEGEKMASLTAGTLQSRYCGHDLCTLTVGGVNTDPEYRRHGCVRAMLDRLFEMSPERGWTVSMLHPFSSAYYRQFGYEKICDHRILTFPLAALDFLPRVSEVKALNSEARLSDALALDNRFGGSRNILFRRFDARYYSLEPNTKKPSTYIWYDAAGAPAAYVTLWVEDTVVINRSVPIALNVTELVFTTPASLRAILGFLRMYDGQSETVKVHNCAMSPELEVMLRDYVHTDYALVSDIAARILDVRAFLEANTYPDAPGRFRVQVDDTLPWTAGLWEVEYAGGRGEVKKLPDGGEWDLRAAMPAFTQLIYGYDAYTPEIAFFMHGVEVTDHAADFFRAFGRKQNGLFEHF